MFNIPLKSLAAVVVGIVLLSTTAPQVSAGAFTSRVYVDAQARDATFTLDFGHPPDFRTTDAAGRAADTFQVEIAAGEASDAQPALFDLTTIIRGDEAMPAGTLPVRNAFPADLTDPRSGGWGSVRGNVPFTLAGPTLTFTAPLALLGTPDGDFAYRALAIQFGSMVGSADGAAEAVPLPAAVWAGMFMFVLVSAAAMARVLRGWNDRAAGAPCIAFYPSRPQRG